MAPLAASVVPTADLCAATRRHMYRLYRGYYDATSPDRFENDLAGKTAVLVLRDQHEILQGFSTLEVFSFRYEDRPLRAIFSGDTVIDHRHWGDQSLAFQWIRYAGEQKRAQPDVPLYWFLISKGHRTYRYLPAFCRTYFPSHRSRTPAREQALMDHLARQRFGQAYDAASGVVRFPHSLGHLAPAWGRVDDKDLRRDEVRYFLSANPNYARGEELVCLAELAEDNLKPLARRIFRRTLEA